MERRFILAIALSMLILLSWSALVSKMQPIGNKAVTRTQGAPISPESLITPPPALTKEPSLHSLLPLSLERYELIFVEPQAAIKEITFKDYQSSRLILQQGFLLEPVDLLFQKEKLSSDEAVFVYSGPDKRITKRLLFHNSSYSIDLEIEIQNISSSPLSLTLPLVLGVLDFAQDPNMARFQDIAVLTEEKNLHPNARRPAIFEKIKFLSLRNRYFCAIIEPAEKNNYGAWVRKISAQESAIGLLLPEITLKPQQKTVHKFRIYLGPQELQYISRINPEWSAVMYYGTFDLIANILLQTLEIIHRLVHNWGWTIIVLSLLIYAILFPLSLKQMRSMKEMQALQPAIEELRRNYKDNPQRLNKEIMALYRGHKVNPLGGCLPLLLQVPVFFALYQVLMRSVALKGANFLWIKDLSEPDRLFILPTALPILGNEINVLPIVMAMGMFIQQKLSLAATTSTSAAQQKLMLVLFPVMFGLIFYHMPSGLVLYWFINSILMLIFQFRMQKAK